MSFVLLVPSVIFIGFIILKEISISSKLIDFLLFKKMSTVFEKHLTQAQFQWQMGSIRVREQTIRYSFYTNLYESLILAATSFGADITESLRYLKVSLKKEKKAKLKAQGELYSGLVQVLLSIFLIQSFAYVATRILPEHLSIPAFGIFLFQSIGMLFYCILFFWLFFRKEELFSMWLERVHLFYLYVRCGLDVELTLGSSKIKLILMTPTKDSALEYLRHRLIDLVSKWKDHGLDIDQAMKELIEDLWDVHLNETIKFSKKIKGIKFIFLAIFALAPYLVMVLSFFSGLTQ
ncbi:hypothetical protein HBN50_11425 [Halobacteriovorax sp. GB3]|uniref:hypothetical protein n=1 Tax=Halobacteriovorax sp. GB3 TaxID=2719615 RepID=UPI002361186E|nr:hypothetical protein [Halobacteriovorax sp. GB3]MDD0853711.1 hypothetical protein [Halobacteriovorax sp. GB3]